MSSWPHYRSSTKIAGPFDFYVLLTFPNSLVERDVFPGRGQGAEKTVVPRKDILSCLVRSLASSFGVFYMFPWRQAVEIPNMLPFLSIARGHKSHAFNH